MKGVLKNPSSDKVAKLGRMNVQESKGKVSIGLRVGGILFIALLAILLGCYEVTDQQGPGHMDTASPYLSPKCEDALENKLATIKRDVQDLQDKIKHGESRNQELEKLKSDFKTSKKTELEELRFELKESIIQNCKKKL